jgi:hypothetical protein
MHACWPAGSAAAQSSGPASRAALAAVAVILVAGCGSTARTKADSQPAGGGQATATVTRCGSTRTAANVPVNVEVEHGQVSCTTAMTVERGYAKAILDGHAPGNGGGGPITVRGWKCQGFPTPEVLKTGQASKCVSGSIEILAILPAPA